MRSDGRVRRSWDVSPRTADSLSKLQLISGMEKSELVDIAINLLFQTTLAVRDLTGTSSGEILRTIASVFPSDFRNSTMEIDSVPMRFDLTQLFSIIRGDDGMSIEDHTINVKGGISAEIPDGGKPRCR